MSIESEALLSDFVEAVEAYLPIIHHHNIPKAEYAQRFRELLQRYYMEPEEEEL